MGFSGGVGVKPEAPLPSEVALQAARALRRGWFGFQRGACVKPEAPLPSEIALQAARIVQQGWFGFHVGACAPKRGWFGFQRGRGCETGSARACFMAPEMGSFGEAGVVWVSAGVWV